MVGKTVRRAQGKEGSRRLRIVGIARKGNHPDMHPVTSFPCLSLSAAARFINVLLPLLYLILCMYFIPSSAWRYVFVRAVLGGDYAP